MKYLGPSMQHLRSARLRFDLKGLVQIHHIIPLEHKNHPFLKKIEYSADSNYNLILMPTHLGKVIMNLREERLIHDGGHMKYNKFILDSLNKIETREEFFELFTYLHHILRYSNDIPWD